MLTRSGRYYGPRISEADGQPCSGGECKQEDVGACQCEDCGICGEREPRWILMLYPYANDGLWIGPHCHACDARLVAKGFITYGGFV